MLSPSSSHHQSQDQKVKVDVATMMEISSESSSSSRRRIRSGRSDGGVQSSNLCKWTSKFATILFLLNLIALGQSLPLDRDMENRVRLGHHHRDRELASSKLTEEPQQPRHYQLVQQGQLYLPSLLQNEQQESLDSGTASNYPINTQNDDDSIGREWETVIDPNVYILNEWASSQPMSAIQQRKRRNAGPSLSIVNPLDVLRQRLLLEIARRRNLKYQTQVNTNQGILNSIGRRR